MLCNDGANIINDLMVAERKVKTCGYIHTTMYFFVCGSF